MMIVKLPALATALALLGAIDASASRFALSDEPLNLRGAYKNRSMKDRSLACLTTRRMFDEAEAFLSTLGSSGVKEVWIASQEWTRDKSGEIIGWYLEMSEMSVVQSMHSPTKRNKEKRYALYFIKDENATKTHKRVLTGRVGIGSKPEPNTPAPPPANPEAPRSVDGTIVGSKDARTGSNFEAEQIDAVMQAILYKSELDHPNFCCICWETENRMHVLMPCEHKLCVYCSPKVTKCPQCAIQIAERERLVNLRE